MFSRNHLPQHIASSCKKTQHSTIQRDIPAHRRWMTRSYALTTAAITLRIYLLIILTQNIPFVPAYRTIAWLCWIPNLLLAEFILIKKQKMH